MNRPSMSTILRSKPFLASAACIVILLAFAVLSPRGVRAGVQVPNQSFVYTYGISETFTGKTASLDLGPCPLTFCEFRIGGSATLNSGHSSNGTIGQFSVTLRGGTDNFYFPATTPNGLRLATTAPSAEDEPRHEGNNHDGYNYVLPPSGPFLYAGRRTRLSRVRINKQFRRRATRDSQWHRDLQSTGKQESCGLANAGNGGLARCGNVGPCRSLWCIDPEAYPRGLAFVICSRNRNYSLAKIGQGVSFSRGMRTLHTQL